MKKLRIKLLLETEPSFAHGHSSQAKVYPFAGQRKYLHSPVALRPWIKLWLQELKQQTPALQASALPTELARGLCLLNRKGKFMEKLVWGILRQSDVKKLAKTKVHYNFVQKLSS